MDGKKPEYSGDLEAAELQSLERTLQPPPTDSSPGIRESHPLLPHTKENAPTSEQAIPLSPFPLANWKLFANLSLPSENAVYSLHDGKGRFLEATDGCQRLWKLSPEEIKGQSIADFLHPGKELVDWLLHIDTDPQGSIYSATALCEGQPYLPVELKRIPLFIGTDPSQSRIVLKTVVTEATLPPLALPTASTLSSTHSPDGAFISVNASWITHLGFPKNELEGRKLVDFVHPIDRTAAESFLGEVNAAGSPNRNLLRFVDSQGRQKSLLVQAKKTPNSDCLSLDAKDMTLDRENPVANLLKISVELVRDSVILLAKGQSGFPICYANRSFEAMTGFSSSRVTGQSISCLNGEKTDLQSISRIDTALNAEEELSIELLLYRNDSDPFWCKAHLYPLRDTAGETHYFAAVLEDVTREKEVATELKEKNRELSEALTSLEETQKTVIQQENLRAIGQMASGIAHDFNNLLAPILGFSELLLSMPAESRNNDKLESFLKKIQIAAQDGAAVVSRLREFYRAHNSEEEAYVSIDPQKLLAQVKDLTKHRWKNQAEARGTNIQFETDIRTKRFIRGNEPELRQSLSNLVINAVDAIKQSGTITVSIEDKKEWVRIQIKDTGNGMPKGIRDKCLDAFFTTKGQLGTGLGLSIVCGIVKRHGGEIAIDSEEGKGTVITMSFPAIEADSSLKEEFIPLTTASKPLNIMLVDDEAVLLEVISELLGSAGHTVDNFSNPKSALEAFGKEKYDLVITDRAMPKMSGDQLAAEIKTLKPETPIYLISGFSNLIERTGEMPPNIDAILPKPIPLETLNRELAKLISNKSA